MYIYYMSTMYAVAMDTMDISMSHIYFPIATSTRTTCPALF